jgi:GT2 family glycosyltransferase
VVIPTYSDSTMLATCLRTLWETVPASVTLEVIVSDDGSPAPVQERVAALVAVHPGTRLVTSAVNGGYIAAVSAGVAAARNEVIITLNNDTLLLPGWLEPLLDTLAADPGVGIVGGRLIYPDGRLQEAGCVIFRDASATKVGYGDDDPERDFYQHPRPVDYVSGALLAIPRALLADLGGLDRAYGFGYYEDGDLCFRARAAGRRVLYQPASTIVHVEGGTAGLDVTRGAKAYQARNQRLFADRWASVLAHHPVRPANLDLRTSRLLAVSERPWMDEVPTRAGLAAVAGASA